MQSPQWTGPLLAPPDWCKDFGGREHIMPFPAKIDTSLFRRPDAVLVKLSATAEGGQNEIQRITVNATSGTFTIAYAGQTTAAIAEAATAAAVQAALEALSNIAPGDVAVSGADGGPFFVEFRGSLGMQAVADMTVADVDLAGGGDTVAVDVVQVGNAGATSLAVDELTGPIPDDTILDFGGGKYAKLAAAAAAAATSLTIDPLVGTLYDNDEAWYAGVREFSIPSGTAVGRTIAERDNEDPFGPAVSTDDEFYLIVFEVRDAEKNDEVELYRPGSLVAENYLPNWTNAAVWTSGMKTKLRSVYQCILGED